MASVYVAVDGDNVGSYLEYLMLRNDPETLTGFAASYAMAMDWFTNSVVKAFDASVVFRGGDNVLFVLGGTTFSIEDLEAIRHRFADRSSCTLSIGVGDSARQAYFALKLAKTSGKNCIRLYKELTND